ncbi:DUF433 domain-containing protein [Echinicola sp. CAU 1574]|uniref:DUF433 domain-containing protein n=1 Tax=Echinicola arenosa TaxID=2774144 RepID=A0ABR9AK44_9BACT|nr:DUF433 domain-containing protein [Echinicola arenosa]
MTYEEILEDFPEINREQTQTCLAYAADRKHKIRVV